MKLRLVVFALLVQSLTLHAAGAKPNIILIYSDNHGYADFGQADQPMEL